MTQPQLRSRVGILLVFGQLVVVVLLVALTVLPAPAFAPDEGQTAIALVVPMLTANTAMYVAYVKDQRAKRKSAKKQEDAVGGDYAFLALLFPSFLFLSLLVTIGWKAATALSFPMFRCC